MDSRFAQKILNDNKQLWDSIASDFSNTRNYIWEDIKNLADYTKPGMKVLDLGCGNGRIYKMLRDKNIDYTGIDISENLIKIAREKHLSCASPSHAQFLVGDGLKLPFKDHSFDIVYSIAVLHHIPSKTFRNQFLKEIKRVLKKDGEVILTVWNLWQRKYFKLLVKYSLLKVLHKSKLDWGDLYISWQNKYQRFHHAFTKKELKKLFVKNCFNVEKISSLKRKKYKTNILIIGETL